MLNARTPCICIDVSQLFNRLTTAGHILWLFTLFCAFTATGLLIFGVFAALAQSWFIRAAADYLRGEKRKRKNGEL
jgi:hypothetical protein